MSDCVGAAVFLLIFFSKLWACKIRKLILSCYVAVSAKMKLAAACRKERKKSMNIADLVVILVLAAALCGIGYSYYKRKKSGKGGCGCGCPGCVSKGKCDEKVFDYVKKLVAKSIALLICMKKTEYFKKKGKLSFLNSQNRCAIIIFVSKLFMNRGIVQR